MNFKKHHLAGLFVSIAVVAALIPFVSFPQSVRAATGTKIYLTPASQTITTSSNLVVSIVVDTGGASVNTVQSVVSYPASKFSLVSITPGSAFSSFPNTASSGSVQFSAATTTPVSGVQTVATLTLHPITSGTASAVTLNSSLCGPGNYTLTCTAAYDATTSNNDLIGATTPITNGSYTVNAPASTTTPPATTTPSSGSTSSSSPKSSSTSSSSKPKTSTSSGGGTSAPAASSSSATGSTPATATTNPVPVITNVTVSNVSDAGATISWQTNIAASSIVDYGLNTKYGLVAQSAGQTTTHSVTISSDLTKATTYYFVVAGATSTGASATSNPGQFTTSGFTITIKIVDKHNKPIEGAQVTSDGQTATSNSAGLVTLRNMPAGSQKVTVKAGHSSTTGSITVGKLNPATGTYATQAFVLTASRASSLTAYIIIVVIALLAAAVIMFTNVVDSVKWRLRNIGKGPDDMITGGGMGTGSGGGPAVSGGTGSSDSAASDKIDSSPSEEDSQPIQQIVKPGTSPDDAVNTPPIKIGNIELNKPENPEPGTTIQPEPDESESRTPTEDSLISSKL